MTTDSTTYVSLGGPSLSVTVPASGMFQVTASAKAPAGEGAVSLYEDGEQVPDQGGDICGGGVGTLFDTPGEQMVATYGTPAAFTSYGCATVGAPGPVLFETTPGEHTYELRYMSQNCGCSPEATFSNRRLWITTMP